MEPEKKVARKSRHIVQTISGVEKTKRSPSFSDSKGGAASEPASGAPEVCIRASTPMTARNDTAFRK